MKNFCFLFFQIFLISINKIKSDDNIDIYTNCEAGKYGENCDKICKCKNWSSSYNCSKIEGRCLDCKFGHHGVDCKDICQPECKTHLCCSILDESFTKSEKEIKTDISTLKIKINNKELKIAIDYNVGYPLAIFNNAISEDDISSNPITSKHYQYTNYDVSGTIYNKTNVEIIGGFNIEMYVILDDNIQNDEEFNGVIGLGFYNSIDLELYSNNQISLNIASYDIDDDDKVSILFGDIFENERNVMDKMSYCNALSENNELTMKCNVEGIYAKDNKEALTLKDNNIIFSLNQNESTFILRASENFITNFTKYYFNDKEKYIRRVNQSDNTTSFCFDKKKVNKLSNLGFIINDYYYYFQADKLLREDKKCEEFGEDYQLFLVEFNNDNPKIALGPDFYREAQYTVDTEEGKIYIYSKKNIEYFGGEFIDVDSGENLPKVFKTNLSPMAISAIIISIVFLLNILSFLVYFYFKRKKEKKFK